VVMHSLVVIGARAYPETISVDCAYTFSFPSHFLRRFLVGSLYLHHAFVSLPFTRVSWMVRAVSCVDRSWIPGAHEKRQSGSDEVVGVWVFVLYD